MFAEYTNLIKFAVFHSGADRAQKGKGMVLIMESGATKTDCCLLDAGGEERCRFRLTGMNMAANDAAAVPRAMRDAVSLVSEAGFSASDDVSELFFYGAGITDVLPAGTDAVREAFPSASCHFHSDLLAAARGLCGQARGIVAILGTGSNSCLYDGERIVKNIRPGGYVLGDEGSAASLGRMFLSDYIKELLPDEVSDDFRSEYGLDYNAVVNLVYKSPHPAADMAAFAPYVMKWRDEPYLHEMICRNFRNFIERSLLRYEVPQAESAAGPAPAYPEVSVTGSFGCACRDILEGLASGYGLRFVRFMPAPMDGLLLYHRKNIGRKPLPGN